MKNNKSIILSATLCCAFTPFSASAAIDQGAAIVKLRTDCSVNGSLEHNCFTNMAALTNWIWNIRNPQPSASAPLLVDIGPGTFSGGFHCANSGYITLRGSGADKTIIKSGYPVSSKSCTQLEFEDLTLEGDRSSSFSLVFWEGGGTSRWSNVNLIMYGYGWVEQSCGSTPGQHYWFGSRIQAYSSFGSLRNYIAACDVTWFIGSEIVSIADTQAGYINSILATGAGEVHVYGSVVRTLTEANVVTTPYSSSGGFINSFAPIAATNGGEIHLHASAVDAMSDEPNQINVLSAESGGMVHANASSYNIRTGAGGSVNRIMVNSGGHIHAPYEWEHIPDIDGNTATVDTNFASANGADQTVVRDGTSDGHPHAAVYSAACPPTARWYDQVDKVCRGQ